MNDQNPNSQTPQAPPSGDVPPSVPAAAPVVSTPTPEPITPAGPVETPAVATATPPPVPVPTVVPPQDPPTTTPGAKKLNIPKLNMKELPAKIKALPLKFKLLGGFVFLLIFLLILVSFTAPGKKVKELIIPPSPTPLPTSTPAAQVFIETPYAQDPEVIEIEKGVTDFNAKVGGTELREDRLRVPNLDWTVNFKQ